MRRHECRRGRLRVCATNARGCETSIGAATVRERLSNANYSIRRSPTAGSGWDFSAKWRGSGWPGFSAQIPPSIKVHTPQTAYSGPPARSLVGEAVVASYRLRPKTAASLSFVRHGRHPFARKVHHDHAVLFVAVRKIADQHSATRPLPGRIVASGYLHHFPHVLISQRIEHRVAESERIRHNLGGLRLRIGRLGIVERRRTRLPAGAAALRVILIRDVHEQLAERPQFLLQPGRSPTIRVFRHLLRRSENVALVLVVLVLDRSRKIGGRGFLLRHGRSGVQK